ncbi:glucose-6-phosphate 1-dehydrogenase [Waddlia chondrophila 2032/99]|uniref:Glucose-6-phosphate 1-dehydrogenase n=1 Tax=Waddlia chondrophila 2032/99 TaxID=765953 RepID=F8LCY5_9BACT|nr:glucose-6-phosphate 1-dehydrogenase [Waddlia chondrophila 2032/99]
MAYDNYKLNPLIEATRQFKIPDSCILVIFGATGDLTARKLVPALYNLASAGQLPAHFACVGFARRNKSHEDFRKEMHEAVCQFSRTKPIDLNLWQSFSEKLFYHQSEFDNDEGYDSLKTFLEQLDNQFSTKGNRVYYLSTQPSFFTLITEKLNGHGLIYKTEDRKKWSRLIIEKPFGHDLSSAKKLQNDLTHHMDESQIYRIDHYLGKETVQNLLVFRFSNPIFESLWNNKHIDHVQITVSEDIGIGTRGHFFEEAGLLRDIVQNHMMQLISLVAMEPPASLYANAIRDEKMKVMESIREFPAGHYDNAIIRGQYAAGMIDGEPVKGYCEEENVDPQSTVETYVAMELKIDNWRWAGVPFFLRAGKRLPKRATEISITFKEAPGFLFEKQASKVDSNILVIRIQPDEGISLKMNCKVPGLSSQIQPVKMDFRYSTYFGSTPPEAYERLICDCMAGDSTLFARADEVLASWKLFTPILQHWQNIRPPSLPYYQAGTWGPEEADNLIEKTGRKWRLL